jgi:acyl-CoA thioesterase I
MSSRSAGRFDANFLEEFVQYSHVEKMLDSYPCAGALDDELLARIYLMPPERYRELRERCGRRSELAAGELLRDQGFAQLVDRLPFRREAVVVAIGDSMTDDWQSWAYILEELLRQRRPDDEIKVVNAGRSGDTTVDLLRRLESILDLNPDWIITLIGTNDASPVRPYSTKVVVSSDETRRNFAAIREVFAGETGARLVWITPPPVSPEDVARERRLRGLGTADIANEDLFRNAELVRRFPDPVIDLWPVFGDPPRSELFFDGLHPNLDGHAQIVATTVLTLAEG